MKILRLIILQAFWFLFIHYSKFEYFLPLVALMVIFIDYKLFYKELEIKRFFRFTLYILACGFMLDSVLMNMQLIHFRAWEKNFSHPFMWAIWILFVPYYQIGLIKLNEKKLIAVILSLIFAPLSYYSGSRFGILELSSIWSFIGIGVLWAAFIPSSFLFYEKAVQGKP